MVWLRPINPNLSWLKVDNIASYVSYLIQWHHTVQAQSSVCSQLVRQKPSQSAVLQPFRKKKMHFNFIWPNLKISLMSYFVLLTIPVNTSRWQGHVLLEQHEFLIQHGLQYYSHVHSTDISFVTSWNKLKLHRRSGALATDNLSLRKLADYNDAARSVACHVTLLA